MAKNEVKWGAILSYILIILNALYGLFLSPYILGKLGDAEYGVYKTISSFTAALMVLDLGLGGTLMRYIAKFRADGDNHKISNYVAMSLIQATLMVAVIGLISFILYFSLDNFFTKSLTELEIVKAKQLYIFLCIGIIAHVFENVMNGIIGGYNLFSIANGLKIIRLLIRIFLIISLLYFFQNSIVLVLIDLFLTCILILVEFLYLKIKLKLKIRLKFWDKKLFSSSFKYTILLFITSIAAQINSNLDNVVIGALISPEAVTIYSMGLLIFAMFEQLSTAISSVMLPTVANTLKTDDEYYNNTQNLIVQVGRIQFMLLGAALVGFIILGKSFIQIWLGNGFEDVYIIVLILMGPSLLELCVNVCLSILRAENNLGFRTCILLTTTVLNAIITVVGTYYWNYFAAAIGTGLSFLIGSVIIMNIYYYKTYKFKMLKIYQRIFGKIWICLILAGLACYFAVLLIESLLIKMFVGIIVFILIYILALLAFGLTKEEKNKFLKRGNNK